MSFLLYGVEVPLTNYLNYPSYCSLVMFCISIGPLKLFNLLIYESLHQTHVNHRNHILNLLCTFPKSLPYTGHSPGRVHFQYENFLKLKIT